MSMSVAASVSVVLGRIRLSLPRHCLCFLEFRRASLLILRSKLKNVRKPPRTSPGLILKQHNFAFSFRCCLFCLCWIRIERNGNLRYKLMT